MKLALIVVALSVTLVGCKSDVTATRDMSAVKDCSFTVVKISGLGAGVHNALVVRCPNSTTTSETQVGKSRQRTVTID